MDKYNVCVVPFSTGDIPIIISLSEFIPEYTISSIVTPAGLGLEGKDIGVIENREGCGYIVTSNLEDSIRSCDIVLILEKDTSSPLYDYAIMAIEEAIHQKKDILCLLELNKKVEREFMKICDEMNIRFRYFYQNKLSSSSIKDITDSFYQPYAPVIFVGELAENIQGYEVFCNLVKMCKAQGIKVSAIGHERANALFNLHSINFSKAKGELDNCVYKINKYIKKIEETEKPEIIIIRLPKPMIKFDEDIRYDFGLSAYLVSQAIPASFFIVCSPYGFFSDKFWEPLSNNFQAKFGYGIDAIHISNKVIDHADMANTDELSFVNMPLWQANKAIEQVSKESRYHFDNLTDMDNIEHVVGTINSNLLHAPYGLIS